MPPATSASGMATKKIWIGHKGTVMTTVAVICNNETWLVCGGRDFADHSMFDGAMSDLIGRFGYPAHLIHGGAKGADAMAASWGGKLAIEVSSFPADWETYGRAAGPIRNRQMRDQKPHKVIAFPGSRGTQNMINLAREKGIDVVEIKQR